MNANPADMAEAGGLSSEEARKRLAQVGAKEDILTAEENARVALPGFKLSTMELGMRVVAPRFFVVA